MEQIKTFRDLRVWVKAHQLVLLTYQLTKKFPADEKYALLQQIRRAVVSVASNIVEGFKRSSYLEKILFYNISEASLEEVKYQLLIARDLNYISEDDYQKVSKLSDEVGIMLYRWIKSQDAKQKKIH